MQVMLSSKIADSAKSPDNAAEKLFRMAGGQIIPSVKVNFMPV